MSNAAPATSRLEQKMSSVRDRFLGSLDQRLEEPRAMIAAASSDPSDMRDLHIKIHDLCGVAGMLALPGIEEPARQALALIQTAEEAGRGLDPDERNRALSALDTVAARALDELSGAGKVA